MARSDRSDDEQGPNNSRAVDCDEIAEKSGNSRSAVLQTARVARKEIGGVDPKPVHLDPESDGVERYSP